jgi:hypothetical protein
LPSASNANAALSAASGAPNTDTALTAAAGTSNTDTALSAAIARTVVVATATAATRASDTDATLSAAAGASDADAALGLRLGHANPYARLADFDAVSMVEFNGAKQTSDGSGRSECRLQEATAGVLNRHLRPPIGKGVFRYSHGGLSR